MPVCAMLRPAYPPGGGPVDEQLPLPLPPAMRNGKPPIVIAEGAKLVTAKRIRGQVLVVPEDETKVAIQEKGISRLIGQFRLCIDEGGKVESVLPLKSTGFAPYDRTIIGAIEKWVYSPYKVGDQAVPVCTVVTFIYTQR